MLKGFGKINNPYLSMETSLCKSLLNLVLAILESKANNVNIVNGVISCSIEWLLYF